MAKPSYRLASSCTYRNRTMEGEEAGGIWKEGSGRGLARGRKTSTDGSSPFCNRAVFDRGMYECWHCGCCCLFPLLLLLTMQGVFAFRCRLFLAAQGGVKHKSSGWLLDRQGSLLPRFFAHRSVCTLAGNRSPCVLFGTYCASGL